jgi:hypothetical protein
MKSDLLLHKENKIRLMIELRKLIKNYISIKPDDTYITYDTDNKTYHVELLVSKW